MSDLEVSSMCFTHKPILNGTADATVKRITLKVITGHPEILDQVPDSSGSKDLTGQSSDGA